MARRDQTTTDRRPASTVAAADAAFLQAFESCELAGADFTHRQHVRLAWVLLLTDPAGATARVERGIRRFAAHLGAAVKYHATITLAWLRLVDRAIDEVGLVPGETFEAWIARASWLLDARRLERHYSTARLGLPAARSAWVEPDLEALR